MIPEKTQKKASVAGRHVMDDDGERISLGAVPRDNCGQTTFTWVQGVLNLIRAMAPGSLVTEDVFEKNDPEGVATLVVIDESSMAVQIKENSDPGALTILRSHTC